MIARSEGPACQNKMRNPAFPHKTGEIGGAKFDHGSGEIVLLRAA